MRTTTPLLLSAAVLSAAACSPQLRSVNNNAAAAIQSAAQPGSPKFIQSLPGETHLGRLQQLTRTATTPSGNAITTVLSYQCDSLNRVTSRQVNGEPTSYT